MSEAVLLALAQKFVRQHANDSDFNYWLRMKKCLKFGTLLFCSYLFHDHVPFHCNSTLTILIISRRDVWCNYSIHLLATHVSKWILNPDDYYLQLYHCYYLGRVVKYCHCVVITISRFSVETPLGAWSVLGIQSCY